MIENTGNKDKKISFMGTEEYRLAIKRAALDRNMDVQALIETALATYLSADQKPKVTPISLGALDESQRRILDFFDAACKSGASAGDATIAGLVLARLGLSREIRKKGHK